jgi:hypothetical protein
VKFPGFDMTRTLTDKQQTGAERCTRMVSDVMLKEFGEDKDAIVSRLSKVCMVKINGQFYCSKISRDAKIIFLKHGVDWSDLNDKENKDRYDNTGI